MLSTSWGDLLLVAVVSRSSQLPGWYWASTSGGLVGFVSPGSSGITWWRWTLTPRWSGSCPSRLAVLTWAAGGKRRRHVPDFLVRWAGGAVMVLDSRPAQLIGERDREAFAHDRAGLHRVELALCGVGSA